MPISPTAHHIVQHVAHHIAWYWLPFVWFWSNLDKWDKVVQIAAIIVGGIAAYYRFVIGRIYKGRLERGITGTAVKRGGTVFITVVATIKNIGASNLDIQTDASVIELYAFEDLGPIEETSSADWRLKGTFPIFENDAFLESGESNSDQCLVTLPASNERYYQAVLSIVAGKSYWTSRLVIPLAAEEQPLGHGINIEWR